MLPINAITVTVSITVLIGLISIGSPTAFNDLVSLTINALYSSYFISCALLLWRRCTGGIKSEGEVSFDQTRRMTSGSGGAGQLVWGPWRIPGLFGIGVNAFACGYMVLIIFFSFWPQGQDPTPVTMNYSCLVTGAVAIFSAIYYMLWAHKSYEGPVVDIEL